MQNGLSESINARRGGFVWRGAEKQARAADRWSMPRAALATGHHSRATA
jgi:hypothetical protein